jgi:hypothetical protein
MTGFKTHGIILLAALLLVVVVFSAIQYGRNSCSSPVSMIELTQPAYMTPRYIAISDPNQKTVSIVMISNQGGTAEVIAVTPYSKITR